MKTYRLATFMLFALSILQAFHVSAQTSLTPALQPFLQLKQTVEGRQLLTIAENAEYDPTLYKQQLDVLAQTGIKAKSIEYEVAQYLAYISIYSALSDIESTETSIEHLQVLGVKLSNDWILALYFKEKAALALQQDHLFNGFDYITQALVLSDQINYQELTAQAKSIRGVFYSKQGKNTLALKDYQYALVDFEATDQKNALIKVYNNIVALYLGMKAYDKAIEASDQMTKIIETQPHKNSKLIAENLINRAIALGYLGEIEQELASYNTAKEYAIRSNDAETLASVYAHLSNFYVKNHKPINAKENGDYCIEIAERINNINLVVTCQISVGLSSIYIDKTSAGFSLLNNALTTIKTEGMKSNLDNAYHSLFIAHQFLGDHKTANSWMEKRYLFLLEQMKDEQSTSISELKNNFQQTVNVREDTHTSIKNNLLSNIFTQEQLVKRLIFGLITLSLFLFISIGFILYYRKKLANKY